MAHRMPSFSGHEAFEGSEHLPPDAAVGMAAQFMRMEPASSLQEQQTELFHGTALYGHGQPGHRLRRRPLSPWLSPAASWEQMQPFGPMPRASSRCLMVLPVISSAGVVHWLTFLVNVGEAWMVQAAASYTLYDLSRFGIIIAGGDPPEPAMWMVRAGGERPMLAPQPALGHVFATELRATRVHTPVGSLHLTQWLLHPLGPLAVLPRLQSPGGDRQHIPPPTDTLDVDVERLVGAPLQLQHITASDEFNAAYILAECFPHGE
ncbi:uncharacterized protein LOC144157821 [Haemaphysalis longicornis]